MPFASFHSVFQSRQHTFCPDTRFFRRLMSGGARGAAPPLAPGGISFLFRWFYITHESSFSFCLSLRICLPVSLRSTVVTRFFATMETLTTAEISPFCRPHKLVRITSNHSAANHSISLLCRFITPSQRRDLFPLSGTGFVFHSQTRLLIKPNRIRHPAD